MTTDAPDHPDAMPPVEAQYRSDGYGHRAVVLPERCPSGEHLLAGGYSAEESNGLLRVTCTQCPPSADQRLASWLLITGARRADHAEFDSRAYPTAMTSALRPRQTWRADGHRPRE